MFKVCWALRSFMILLFCRAAFDFHTLKRIELSGIAFHGKSNENRKLVIVCFGFHLKGTIKLKQVYHGKRFLRKLLNEIPL